MDKAQDDFNKASHVLLDAEVRLNGVSVQIQQIERELALLKSIEANFEENIRVLKSRRVIVIASEFKKSLMGLDLAKNKQSLLRIDMDGLIKIEKAAQAEYERARLAYDNAWNLLHNPPNNVIQVDFGRKNGQK